MSDRRKPFPFDTIEPRWQDRWAAENTFRTPGPGDADFRADKPKYYVLDMFPYPSGAGLHVGHPEGYTATDIIARYKRMRGFNVLHPMGWDAFGLPAEQYAIKTGQHPRVTTEANVKNFRKQLQSLGFSYDWEREVDTTDPSYVRWTQWIFLQLYHSYYDEAKGQARPVSELEAQGWTREQVDAVRLAFVHEAPVNWSPDLGTVLANEEVEEWKSKGHTVERRPLRQWMLRITAYAERLLHELDDLDWPEGIKLLQKNWIGKSEGACVDFTIGKTVVTVFTTRPDTLFGATYMVLAPEHPLVATITTMDQRSAVDAYVQACASKSDMERGEMNKEKSGVFTGAYATNPVNGKAIPVWIADYVMMGYGTGAIMAVPAHDERDFEFAQKMGLPSVQVVSGKTAGSDLVSTATASPYFESSKEISKTRHNLPHWQQPGKRYFVTFRLADSIPAEALTKWQKERDAWLQSNPEPWSDQQEEFYFREFADKIDQMLDAAHGSCLLREANVAEIVSNALKHFHGERYLLEVFVIMPNHVHLAFTLHPEHDLADVVHSWKSFTAHAVNKDLGRDGELWQRDYFDRMIRDETHWERVLRYIEENPRNLREGFVLYRSCQEGGEGGLGCDAAAAETAALPAILPVAINSGFLNGMPTAEAKQAMIAWLEAEQKGSRKVQYKLRDWLFSRQRYWGEPFPIYWENGQHFGIPERELPLLQPEMEDFKPTGDPRGPLVKASDWIAYSETAQRETNTMPQWAGSCWYYLRYCDPKNEQAFLSREAEQYWLGGNGQSGAVDLYVGGTEHAVLHLLYARFWHKVMYDLGHLTTREPFQKLVNQGLILGEDGQKMSKSIGNVVNPDVVVRDYGADSLRLYEMFMGPLEQVKPWQMKGVEGVHRFLARVWRIVMVENQEGDWVISPKLSQEPCSDSALRKVVHETIRKVGEDIEKLAFNTAISQMMICTNAFTQAERVPVVELLQFLQVLNPFAPHLSEELHWLITGSTEMLYHKSWPAFDPGALVENEIELVVQVNGKLRERIRVSPDATEDEVLPLALAATKVKEHTDGKTMRKVIYVKGRLLNLVVS